MRFLKRVEDNGGDTLRRLGERRGGGRLLAVDEIISDVVGSEEDFRCRVRLRVFIEGGVLFMVVLIKDSEKTV